MYIQTMHNVKPLQRKTLALYKPHLEIYHGKWMLFTAIVDFRKGCQTSHLLGAMAGKHARFLLSPGVLNMTVELELESLCFAR